MPTLRNTLATSAPPEALWSIVGDPERVAAWIPGIERVSVEWTDADRTRATRVCTFAGDIVQHEEIADYSPVTRSYRYQIEGGPMPLRSNRGRLTVRGAGDGGSLLEWESEIEPADPAQATQIVGMLDGAYKQVLDGLKRLVEAAPVP